MLRESLLDWDEGIYLLVADDVLRGVLPYAGSWDHKPPGLYYLYALGDLLPGGGVIGVRLLAVACVAVTAWQLSRLHAVLWPGLPLRTASGVLYVLLSVANGGLAANSEVLFAPFVVTGIRLALAERTGPRWRFGGAGLCLGLAFAIKPVSAAELLGLAALAAPRAGAGAGAARGALLHGGGALAVGFALAVALVCAPHRIAGEGRLLWESAVVYNLAHAGSASDLGSGLGRAALAMSVLSGLVGALVAAPVLLARGWPGWSRDERRAVLGVGVWLASALAAALVQRRLFPHHFLPLLAPLCLLLGGGLGALRRDLPAMPGARALPALLIGLIFLAGPFTELEWRAQRLVREAIGYDRVPLDLERAAAEHLLRQGEAGSLYVYNWSPVLYHLAGARPPTRFAFPPHLIAPTSRIAAVFGVDPLGEIRRVLRERPAWIVVRESSRPAATRGLRELRAALHTAYSESARWPVRERAAGPIYRLQTVPGEAVVVYRRRATRADPGGP